MSSDLIQGELPHRELERAVGAPTRIYLVTGFLTELPIPREEGEGQLARLQRLLQQLQGEHDLLQTIDGRGWVRQLRCALPVHCSLPVELFPWHSRRLIELLPALTPLIQHLIKRRLRPPRNLPELLSLLRALGDAAKGLRELWEAAREAAEAGAVTLAHRLEERHPPDERLILIGHSLGARLALRTATLISPRPLSVLALAPAIREAELGRFAPSRPMQQVEIAYSERDLILRWLYFLAEFRVPSDLLAPPRGALGFSGPLPGSPFSPLDCTPNGHFSYLSSRPELLPRSHLYTLLA